VVASVLVVGGVHTSGQARTVLRFVAPMSTAPPKIAHERRAALVGG